MPRPNVLIEKWLPIKELSVECQRERGASSALPPLYFLHVWWARRPLIVSRAAVLASLLPQWSSDWPKDLINKFPSEHHYHEWFKRFIGILGDPGASQQLALWAKEEHIKLNKNPFDYKRAFTVSPSPDDLELMRRILASTWGEGSVSMLDPMAGGGSIPFEALRHRFHTHAYELNPVAVVILKATVDYPARFGMSLKDSIEHYGGKIASIVRDELSRFYPIELGESIHAYLWARTVACPTTGKPVPLSPNWWLVKSDKPLAVRLICEPQEPECRFEIVRGKDVIALNPDKGTIKRGVAVSPWTGDAIPGDYIKREAQAGRMGQQLYAVGIKKAGGFDFRLPTPADLDAAKAAQEELARKLPEWEAKGLVPSEKIREGHKTREPLNYGMPRWCDMFSPRQLLSLCTFLEAYHEVMAEVRADLVGADLRVCPEEGEHIGSPLRDKADAIATYLAIAFDKAANYNSRLMRWHSSRQVIAGTFDRHDFSFKWSYGEFDASRNLFPWCLEQVIDAYKGLAGLAEPSRDAVFGDGAAGHSEPVIKQMSATDLSSRSPNDIDSKGGHAGPPLRNQFHLICVDPPYYDNVMYGELSDFFYVWMKRTLGDVYPELFRDELTNKDDEAVANPARFKEMAGGRTRRSGPTPGELAEQDYERKMGACFREMNRVLHPDGVLTVMFTHKRVEAWNTLGRALIEAGFVIKASWPVRTESEHSLHQARKNAAASTILLVCRKRQRPTRQTGQPESEAVWWDDIREQVRRTAREKAREFHELGLTGVDLYISTFGPVLSILSERWPVFSSSLDEKTGKPQELSPDVALNIAREEVIRFWRQGLLLGRNVEFDAITDWYLAAWVAFEAEEFPADEARMLALALNLDIEADLVKAKRVIAKKGSDVVLQLPKLRRKKGLVGPDALAFDCLLDKVHTAMLVFEEDGSGACGRFLSGAGLLNDSTFAACLQAMINAVPRKRAKGGEFLRPEAKLLDDLRLNFFPDLQVPKEVEPPIEQKTMLVEDEID